MTGLKRSGMALTCTLGRAGHTSPEGHRYPTWHPGTAIAPIGTRPAGARSYERSLVAGPDAPLRIFEVCSHPSRACVLT